MVLFSSVLVLLLFNNVDCFTYGGKKYNLWRSFENGVEISTIYAPGSDPKADFIVSGVYSQKYLKTGWDELVVEANPEYADEPLALLAGYLEGRLTYEAIYDHWYNTVRGTCDNQADLCDQVRQYLRQNVNWMKDMIKKYKDTDEYWNQVVYFSQQVEGIYRGYNDSVPRSKAISTEDFWWLNLNWDFEELMSAFKNESERSLQGKGHCSALIKVLSGQSDILVAHNTWTGYETMRRILKKYKLPMPRVAADSMAFSSYPGAAVSGDDFYIMSSGLVAIETTNGNNNASLWANIKPTGQVLEVIRVTIANRLATSGRSWTNIFSRYNSGTYNNQWMIVDMNKFSPGEVRPGLLYVLEQLPGFIRSEELTGLLLRQSYWASYNVPFYPDIFNMSGNQEMVQKYGDFFTHDKNPRAQIFRRDHDKVFDLQSMMRLMRSNDYTHDPFSKCECNPPYSAENAIAARCDLNPANGTYPFPALSHRSHGATDAKVTNFQLAKSLSFMAVSGPTTGAHLPPFQWSRSDYKNSVPHRGHPDLFNFQPITVTWAVPGRDTLEPSVHMVH